MTTSRAFIAIAMCFLIGLAIAIAQTGREVPPYPGDGNPQHNGQPRWCQNKDTNGFIHNCACRGMSDQDGIGMCTHDGDVEEHGDPRCKTYCRRSACSCHEDKCSPSTR